MRLPGREAHAQSIARAQLDLAGDLDRELGSIAKSAIEEARRSELLEELDRRREAELPLVAPAQFDMLRANAQSHVASGEIGRAADRDAGGRVRTRDRDPHAVLIDFGHPRREEIHPRRADEARHEPVAGLIVEIERRADLLDTAGTQYDDL